jgi:hypothetical protein
MGNPHALSDACALRPFPRQNILQDNLRVAQPARTGKGIHHLFQRLILRLDADIH